MKNLMVMTAAAAMALIAANAVYAVEYGTFTDATQVNLLERWNPGGTYGLTITDNLSAGVGAPSRATWYRPHMGWRLDGVGRRTLDVTYTLPQAMDLSKVLIQFRDNNHSPWQYTIADQNGVIANESTNWPPVAGVPPNWSPTARWTNVAPGRAASQYIRVYATVPPDTGLNTTYNNIWDILRVGAFAESGQTVALDGTYNVFREEVPKGLMTVATSRAMSAATLTDGVINSFNCGLAGWIEWNLSQKYSFNGVFLAKYENNFAARLLGLKFEVNDGSNWVTVFGAADIQNDGYMAFSGPVTGQSVRMSWADQSGNGGGREITELQLFGALEIPEPASLALLGLGALTLLRRKRS